MLEKLDRRTADVVRTAASRGILVPAFNIPYLPMMEPVVRSLCEYNTFGMIQVARLEIVKFESGSLTAIADEYRRIGDRSVTSLHLDHTPVIDEDSLIVDWRSMIQEALGMGYGSVMIDGSRLPLHENVDVTAGVVEMAHAVGVPVEAELGSVLGHESGPIPPYEELFAKRFGFTKSDEAAEFVKKTGVDWLSVSVGSVHGAISQATKDQPKIQARIDLDLLGEIYTRTGVPLVLHGGSGIPVHYIKDASRRGLAKLNIATDIRQPYERVVRGTGDIEKAQKAVYDAVCRLIESYDIAGSAQNLTESLVNQL